MAEIKRRKKQSSKEGNKSSKKGTPKQLHKPNKELPWIRTKEELPPETHDIILYYDKHYGSMLGVSYVVLQHMTKKESPIHVLAWFIVERSIYETKAS